jgi:hypothetical protein
MADELMKSCFRLFQRSNGIYFCENRQTGQQESLRTRDPGETERLPNAKNEAQQQPGFALHIARAYLAAADPATLKRTWRTAAEKLIKAKHGENARRWDRAVKDQALAVILDQPLVETHADQFLAVLNAGTVSTNVFLRQLHNFALGMGWLLTPVLGQPVRVLAVAALAHGLLCGLTFRFNRVTSGQSQHP